MAKRALQAANSKNAYPRLDGANITGANQDAQAQSTPAIVPADNRTADQTLAVPVAALGPAATNGAPALVGHTQGFDLSGLTADIWKLILGRLQTIDLIHAIRCCRQFHEWGSPLLGFALQDRQSDASRRQAKIVRDQLRQLREQQRVESDEAGIQQLSLSYGQKLSDLASRLQRLDLWIANGFESGAVNALLEGRCWHSARIEIDADADHDVIQKLENGLLKQKRHCRLELVLHSTGDLNTVMPTGSALVLEGLELIDADHSEIGPLQALLEGNNSLRHFAVAGDETSGLVLPWLLKGCANLVSLHLDDLADIENCQQLIEVLRQNRELTSLGLGNGTFSSGGTTLARVLEAAPKLRSLFLNAIYFGAGADLGSERALKQASLIEFRLDQCQLKEQTGALPDDHQELLRGLSTAPGLEVMDLELFEHEASSELLLEAWARSPAARVFVCFDQDQLEYMQEKLPALNEKRSQAGLALVSLQLKSTDGKF